MMKRKLTRLYNEAAHLQAVYDEYKHSDDEALRRRATVNLDRFLMENREAAIILMTSGLAAELKNMAPPKQAPWYKRLMGGKPHVNNNHQVNS